MRPDVALSEPTPTARATPPFSAAGPSSQEFGRWVRELSEPERPFFSDNLVSNEADYLDATHWLMSVSADGVYMGVGPEQNLSYIPLAQPRLAFIIDIRRDNMLQHLLYKVMFERSPNRAQWLATLLGRRPPNGVTADADVRSVIDSVLAAPRAPAVHERILQDVLARMETWGIASQADDERRLRHMLRAFFDRQLDVRFDAQPAREDFPSLKILLEARAPDGRQLNFLADAASYAFIQRFQRENRLIPVVGDFAGPHTLQALSQLLREIDVRVSVAYVSNVEQYLLLDERWDAWRANLERLPRFDDAWLLRTYSDRLHPHPSQGGRVWLPLAQRISVLLENRESPKSYWQLALASSPPPRRSARASPSAAMPSAAALPSATLPSATLPSATPAASASAQSESAE